MATSILDSVDYAALYETIREPDVVFDPSDPYGNDLSCLTDLDPTMREVSGIDGLREAVFRRITTPRGMVIDAPNYGIDVRTFLSQAQTPATRAALPSIIAAEIRKDERIASCTVTITNVTPDSLRISIACVAGVGPFSLTIGVAAAAVKLLEAA